MHWRILSQAIGLTLLLAGCGGEPTARVYTVPKEAPAPATPAGMNMGTDMANRNLPQEMLNTRAIPPAWQLPDGWETVPASSMRIATFRVPGAAGAAELAVTSFPGDVGGQLANVNRWRGQLGLPPVSEDALRTQIERVDTPSGEAIVVAFDHEGTATRVATLMHDNASWFFKMTGPTATVQAEAGNFRTFMESIDFAATHNH